MLVFSDTLYRCSSPSTLPWWSCIWSTAFSSGHLREFLERVQWRITKMTGGLKHLLCEERLRELSCSGWRRKAFGEISWMFIKCGSQVDGGELFLVACNNKRRGNGHKLKHKKFHTNTGKNFSTVRVTELCNRLHRGVVEHPPLERFKIHLDAYMRDLL